MSYPLRRLLIIVLVTILLVGAVFALGLRKTVILSVDGKSTKLTTYAFTVGSLLRELDVPLSPKDNLSPAQDAWLKNGAQVTLLRAIPVQVLADGKLHPTTSADRTLSTLLSQVGVKLDPGDQVLYNGLPVDITQPFPPQAESISLQVVPSVNYTLFVGDKDQQLTSSAPTLGSALWAAGHILYAADELLPTVDTLLTPDLSAEWKPSRQVNIKTQFGDVEVRTPATTVGEALQDAHLSIQGMDYSQPALDEPLPSDGEIRLIHVTEDVMVEQTPVPFETTYQPVSDLEIDNQSIVQTGEYALNAQRVRIRFEDGEEISRQVEVSGLLASLSHASSVMEPRFP